MTLRTTLPASPPAMSANPMKRMSRARQTARASPKPSSPRTRSLSMRLMMSMPRSDEMPGTQSTNETCTGGGICGSSYGACACADKIAASRNVQFASANCSAQAGVVSECERLRGGRVETHQTAGEVDSHGALVLAQRPARERVEAYPPRVVV